MTDTPGVQPTNTVALTDAQHTNIINLTEAVKMLLDSRRPREIPWVIRVWLFLLFFCVALIGISALSHNDVSDKVLALAYDNLKLVFGGVIGALTAAGGAMWSQQKTQPVVVK